MDRLAPVSNRLRMNTVNHLVRPDSTIAELVLMHDEGRVHTNVRMKATHTNSLWSKGSASVPLSHLACTAQLDRFPVFVHWSPESRHIMHWIRNDCRLHTPLHIIVHASVTGDQ